MVATVLEEFLCARNGKNLFRRSVNGLLQTDFRLIFNRQRRGVTLPEIAVGSLVSRIKPTEREASYFLAVRQPPRSPSD